MKICLCRDTVENWTANQDQVLKSGEFAAVRQLLETQKETQGFDWLFVGSNYLASDDTDFTTICAAIVSAGIMTQAELDAMLQNCLWEPMT